jgi:hypothetical protein
MTEDNKKQKSLIPVVSTRLVRVGDAINITSKILFARISDLFNTAFCKMNSKDIKYDDLNYLLFLDLNPSFRKRNFLYEANSKENFMLVLTIFSKILKIKPRHFILLEMMGICKSKLEDYVGAIEDYYKTIKIDTYYASAYNGRGIAKGNLEDYSKAIVIDPNNSSHTITEE